MNTANWSRLYHELGKLYTLPDNQNDMMVSIRKLSRLIKKHKRLCEDYCNTGDDKIDFKIGVIEVKINKLVAYVNDNNFRPSATATPDKMFVKFQHDPRGATVQVFIGNENDDISDVGRFQLWECLQ
jgi:hypothetical protein